MTASVTSAQLVRNIAQLKRQANAEPIFVTNHGNATHVMVTADHYRELSAAPASDPLKSIVEHDAFRLLAASLEAGFLACDAQTCVVFANPVAAALTCRTSAAIMGMPILEALPEMAGTVLEAHMRRTLTTGEPTQLDLPSPFRPENYLRAQFLPLEGGFAMIFRDITEDVRRHRLADVKEAMLRGMEMHGAVAYARVTPRGSLQRVTSSFAAMIGLPPERLAGVAIGDIVPVGRRVAFKDALEAVLDGGDDVAINTALLTNSGNKAEVRVAMSALRGLYGSEGAALIVAPQCKLSAER